MKQAMTIFGAVAMAFLLANASLGYPTAYGIGYGAVSLMAMMISLTFLWLWATRATPLALGMSFSWAGTSSVMGWWWSYNLLGRPVFMNDNQLLFVFLALYFTGAVLHFQVIQRSVGIRGMAFVVPVFLAVAAAASWVLFS